MMDLVMVIDDLICMTSQWRCPVDFQTCGSKLRIKIWAAHVSDIYRNVIWSYKSNGQIGGNVQREKVKVED